MARGCIREITVMYGGRIVRRLAFTRIGRRIVTVIGDGCRHMVGYGSTTSPGDGRHIITGVGYGMAGIGIGRLTVITELREAGGVRLWL